MSLRPDSERRIKFISSGVIQDITVKLRRETLLRQSRPIRPRKLVPTRLNVVGNATRDENIVLQGRPRYPEVSKFPC
jgi:hypothetical protein